MTCARSQKRVELRQCERCVAFVEPRTRAQPMHLGVRRFEFEDPAVIGRRRLEFAMQSMQLCATQKEIGTAGLGGELAVDAGNLFMQVAMRGNAPNDTEQREGKRAGGGTECYATCRTASPLQGQPITSAKSWRKRCWSRLSRHWRWSRAHGSCKACFSSGRCSHT